MDALWRELKRGTIELILLKLLEGESMYGYQIVSTLERRGGEPFRVQEGTLYPVLYRLEDKGFVESFRDNPEKRGVPRKYYRLTDSGRNQLTHLTAEWTSFAAIVGNLLNEKEQENESE